MHTKTVYITSKGMFWDRAEAEKKTNRAKIYGNRPGDPVELENVIEDFVLVDADHVFTLQKVTVK